MKAYIKKYWFIIAIIIACILKQLLTSWLPVYARDSAGVDQWKLLTDAENILAGNYITGYHAGTLFKRAVTLPLFLAVCNFIGIPYLTGYTMLYTSACLLALIAMMKLTDNRGFAFAGFVVILFSPTTYDTVVQLVYNLSFSIPLAVWTLSCLMVAYLKRNEKVRTVLLWNILAGLGAGAIWLNREDSMWILPLLMVYVVIILIGLLRDKSKYHLQGVLQRLGMALLPVAILWIGNFALCSVNYYGYGIFTTNDYTDTNFAKAYNSILRVKPDYYPDYCSITHGTLEKLYEVSPAMKELEPYLESGYKEKSVYVTAGRNPEDGEVEDGWMNFFLREAAAKCGYYESAVISDEFWGRVSEEVDKAIEDGVIEERNITFFGSVLHHPWRSNAGYMKRWLSSVGEFIVECVPHRIEHADVTYNTVSPETVERYEAMTLGYSVSEPVSALNGSGWLFCNGLNEEYSVRIVDEEGNVYQNLEWLKSDDIKAAYQGEAADLSACRFAMKCTIPWNANMYFEVVLDSGEVYGRIPVMQNEGVNVVTVGDVMITCGLDMNPFMEKHDLNEAFARRRVNLANAVGTVYKKLGVAMFLLSILIYVVICIELIRTIQTGEYRYLDEWIFMSAILGCILILLVALSYIDAFMWGTIWYSAPITALLDFLYGISIVCGGNVIQRRKRNELQKD